jgi:uncharacterized protein YbjT (DUF2867 family)
MSMRLFVLGATGRTGAEIVDLARARGHEVTAFVRSPQKLTPARSFPCHDAVLSAIGPPAREALRAGSLVTDCARATVQAMARSGVARIAIISAAVLFPEKGLDFTIVRWILRHHVRDLRSMEDIVRTSGLAWTIARPPRLTKSSNARFRAVSGALPTGSRVVSYSSRAAVKLDSVEHRSHVAEIVGLGQ